MATDDLAYANVGSKAQIEAVELLRRVKDSNVDLRTAVGEVRASVVELKQTLHSEEVKIKNLTWALVALTVVLVIFGWMQYEDMKHVKGLMHSVIRPVP